MPWRNELLQQHADRKSEGLWRELKTLESAPGRTVTIGGKSFLNFCSNNYLSLSGHPKLAAAAKTAIDEFGVSTSASHLIAGHTRLHHELEHKIATFVGSEKAMLFSTGYMANLAIPPTFLSRNDLLTQDRLNHASIIDGAKLSTATLKRYAHGNTDAARSLLAAEHKRKMMVTDGVFSMDGDLAPLIQLKEVCDTHDAVMVVDDAHGFGVIGARGAGTLDHCGLAPTENTLLLGTLSKAAGSFGAFVAGDGVYIDHLIQHARSFIYTTALPCSAVAAAIAAIELIEAEPWRRTKLQSNIAQFQSLASHAGIALMQSSTPIQPVIVNDSAAAVAISDHLKNQGILSIAIRPPTVPIGSARIRLTIMTDHTEEDIERLVSALKTAPFLK